MVQDLWWRLGDGTMCRCGDSFFQASAGKKEKGLWTPGGDRKIGSQKSRLLLNPQSDSRGRQQFQED
jgi:hypothetical protein